LAGDRTTTARSPEHGCRAVIRVVVTVPWGERLGGAEEMLAAFLTHVDRTRVEPTVVFLEPGGFERELAGLGLRTVVIESGRLRQVRRTIGAVRRLSTFLHREQPDVVLNWSPKTQLYGALAASVVGLGGRVVWWQHGVPSTHWIDRLATALPARAVGCSSAASSRAQAALRPRRRTFVVHPGVQRPNGSAGRPLTPEELGIPPERTVLGIVGRLQPWKGQHLFLEAIAELRERGRDVHGLVVGGDAYGLSPAYARELAQLVEELGLSGAVTMTGQVPSAWPYLAAMDVLVNCSSHEPFGIVLLEAMSASLPVVAVASSGPLEIVENGRSGLLIPDNEPDTLARALDPLVGNKMLRGELGRSARDRAVKQFSVERMARALEQNLVAVGGVR
jgi:glycosyltransferase involved in cell wall biosynthesis